MTPIFPPPIKLPSFIFHSATNVWSALIVSITALLYLAMTLISFLPESDTQSRPSLDHPTNLSIKEKRNENRITK
jgi:hypothetical protein